MRRLGIGSRPAQFDCIHGMRPPTGAVSHSGRFSDDRQSQQGILPGKLGFETGIGRKMNAILSEPFVPFRDPLSESSYG
jgi:hypothetical protein